MAEYDLASQQASALITRLYSTSFSMAIRLLPADCRPHICNIYGLVRIADEIVDTYRGKDSRKLLDALEQETYAALDRGFSTNILVHAFAATARAYGIGRHHIGPFFASMRMDIDKRRYSPQEYETYIYGSAEVVGLMCLAVFCRGDKPLYQLLEPGAEALGSAFQKVNFLRDVAADANTLGRMYFPNTNFDTLDEAKKQAIIQDIQADFAAARQAIALLPRDCQAAVTTACDYFEKLLHKIKRTPVSILKQHRVRISNGRKVALLTKAVVTRGLTRKHSSG